MNCQEAKALIEPYADGELDAANMVSVERHIKDCPACAAALANLKGLKKELKQDALSFKAPDELRRRIKAELPLPDTSAPRLVNLNWSWNWLTTVMSGAAAICLVLLVGVLSTRSSSEHALSEEVVSGHVRSLMADHVMDVASTDQHTVKPWFNGKLDFSPPVKDLAAKDFPLVGGRLDYIGGRSVAALVFHRNKHTINLFIWPAKEADSKPVVISAAQGYHLIRWSDVGMVFWAVSDLNEKELMEFADLYSGTIPMEGK